jgi:hypothetical protein
MDATNLGTRYNLPLLDWGPIQARLEQGLTLAPDTGGPNRHSCWLCTVNGDGSPHVTAVGALVVDGSCWFVSGPGTRKGRNLAADARCSLSVATAEYDLAVDGAAERITDPEVVERMAQRWVDNGWPARVDDTGLALVADYNAPSAGPPPWSIYRIVARSATALQTVAPGGATRWTF